MKTTRREFVKLTAAGSGALIFGIQLGFASDETAATVFHPNVWLRIDTEGTILVKIGKSEMGQGVRTSLPMILAEELDADFDDVAIEQASPGPDFERLGTGGSGSIMRLWDPLREAGAAARMMLVAAAADRWDVSPDSCRTGESHVTHDPTGRRLPYRELVADASRLPVPDPVVLKLPEQFTLLGKSKRRIDGPAIVTGKAVYGLDVRRPGMLYAVVARSPVLGGSVKQFDAKAAKKVQGVRGVFEIPSGVAVVAENTWSALRGREELSIEWDEGPHRDFDIDTHMAALAKATEEPGITIRKDGEGRAGFAGVERRLEALYLYPFAAHASVEPVNCTALVEDGRCELWSPTQTPNAVQASAAHILGIERSDVTVNVTLLGGGFGRRLGTDFDQEAVHVARQIEGTPVQLVWSREDDIRHGYFQAASAHRLVAALDENGRVVGMEHRKVSTPHNARGPALTEEQKVDPDTVRGSAWGVYDSPYAAPHAEMTYRVVDAPVPIGPWRSVFSPSSVFARESFLDEVATAVEKDPFALRHELLGADDPDLPASFTIEGDTLNRPRMRKLLDVLEARSGWNRPLPRGRARGMAANVFHTETYIGYVVEVSKRKDAGAGELPFTVDRVVCAIDCGVAINPNGIEQQVESGVLWSLSNMMNRMTFRQGMPQESSYLDFPVAMLRDTPRKIEVHIVESDDPRPHGVGEPVVDPLAPAVANALYRLTGKRYRELPITEL